MQPEVIFQVSEFNQFIRTYLNQVGEVTVEGEISEFRINQNKWVFMTIKDRDASLEVFGITFQLNNVNALEVGMQVQVSGTPHLYAKTGRFSLSATNVTPSGAGALQIAFERLKKALEAEGLFAAERKRRLPQHPTRIGLVTAKGSQAYQDFVKVVGARIGGLKIVFYPVQVQGKGAEESVVRAILFFNQRRPEIELIVVARGGGSLEDLMAFNDERVVRAIVASKIPVVSAIGHEGDISLADLAADLRASTPSNAAELIVRHRDEIQQSIDHHIHVIETALRAMITKRRQRIDQMVYILERSLKEMLSKVQQQMQRVRREFDLFENRVVTAQEKVRQQRQTLIKAVAQWLDRNKQQLLALRRLLDSLDYRRILARGFSITVSEDGTIVKDVSQLSVGSKAKHHLAKGVLISRIEEIQ